MAPLGSRWQRLVDARWTPYALFAWFVVTQLLCVAKSSTWFDESYSLLLSSQHGFADIASRTAVDGHPPLWYWVVKPWLGVFGATIVAMRAEQSLFMIASLALWFRFYRTRFSRATAVVFLVLAVTNPMIVRYGVEGRMYAFGILLTSATTTLLTSRWRWRWFAYWPLAVAMLYTHYFLSFVILGHFVWLLLVHKQQGLRLWWVVLFGASIVAAFTPWFPYALAQTTNISRGFWIPPVQPSTVLCYVLAAFIDCIDPDPTGWLVFPVLVFFVAFATAVRNAMRPRGGYAVLWCVLAAPWVCLYALSAAKVPVFHPRYVLFSFPALIGLVGVGVLVLEGRIRALVFSAIVLTQLVGLRVYWRRGNADIRGLLTMKRVAAEVHKPIDGDLPTVVATWQFGWFDARATLPMDQRVVNLKTEAPQKIATDAIFFDKPNWWTMHLHDVHARWIWVLDAAEQPPIPLPANWHVLREFKRGYVFSRLVEVRPD